MLDGVRIPQWVQGRSPSLAVSLDLPWPSDEPQRLMWGDRCGRDAEDRHLRGDWSASRRRIVRLGAGRGDVSSSSTRRRRRRGERSRWTGSRSPRHAAGQRRRRRARRRAVTSTVAHSARCAPTGRRRSSCRASTTSTARTSRCGSGSPRSPGRPAADRRDAPSASCSARGRRRARSPSPTPAAPRSSWPTSRGRLAAGHRDLLGAPASHEVPPGSSAEFAVTSPRGGRPR